MFNKVAIIGIGLLGGSLARDLRQQELAKQLVGVCRSAETAKQALADKVVDAIEPLQQAVSGADLIVLATPMQSMLPILETCQQQISATAILTDVGSVKTDLYQELKASCPELLKQFVLAHPIAGGEHSGVAASRSGLFLNKHLIITETEEVDAQATKKIVELWQTVGAKVVKMSLMEHDSVFAKTSHLPHVIAFSLVNFLHQQADNERLFDLAAAGFYDFTRIASSDAEMWRDICITNQAQIKDALHGYRQQLDAIIKMIDNADQQDVLDYFLQAKAARDSGLLKKQS